MTEHAIGFDKGYGEAAGPRDAEIEKLRAALETVETELTNLQPHIPQACKPGRESFIDVHVDKALSVVRGVLNDD